MSIENGLPGAVYPDQKIAELVRNNAALKVQLSTVRQEALEEAAVHVELMAVTLSSPALGARQSAPEQQRGRDLMRAAQTIRALAAKEGGDG